MYLKTLSIRNFRILQSIDCEFGQGVNVIVGPNAAGKTTILEAIRLAKSLLAQRTQSESQQTLISLGAMSPQNNQQLISEGLVTDKTKKLEILCGYQLTASERDFLLSSKSIIATRFLQARTFPNQNPAAFAAFISSPGGKAALAAAEGELDAGLKRVELAAGACRLDLSIDFSNGLISTHDPAGAALFAYLDQTLPPGETKFSYFPADRALPRGEVQMQIGAQDSGQQLESHNSQPQLKYSRLKNLIFNTIIERNDGRDILNKEFEKIFDGVLKGRELVGAGISQHGLLSIKIREKASQLEFDLDGLSSGEKGLVLTFLTIGRASAAGGIVLLDEPELHLNPAVCKDLLAFIVDNYQKPKDLQIITCSHSPEILAGAIERDECALYHLESPSKLIRITRSDEETVAEALRRLGTSEGEGLLHKGTVFVEGPHDIQILEIGFGSLLRNYKLKDLGGRTEVEKQIRKLQESDTQIAQQSPRFFIFDRDDAPTNIVSTKNVKVLQWGRRCLENYLIDVESIADLLRDPDVTHAPVSSTGEVANKLKALALQQLDAVVIRDVYAGWSYESLGHRPFETASLNYAEAADVFLSRIEKLKKQVDTVDQADWRDEFIAKCTARRLELFPVWDASWKEVCDGKKLFKDVQQTASLKFSLLSFKKRVMLQMLAKSTEGWRAMESVLKGFIESAA